MNLVQVGRRFINLEYLILAELWDGSEETRTIPQEGIRVTLETGKEFDLRPPDSVLFRKYLEEITETPPRSAGEGPTATTGRSNVIPPGGGKSGRKRPGPGKK